MQRRLLIFFAHAAAAATLLAIGGCIKSGSEIGPKLPQLEEESSTGIVMDSDGNPISNAYVTVGPDLTFTDQRGRFRFRSKSAQKKIVNIDARFTSVPAPGGGIFDTLVIAGTFEQAHGVFPRPIVMPNFAKGVSAEIIVNTGAPLAGILTDPTTGAQLDLNGAVAFIPGSSVTKTTLRFVSIPATAVPKELTINGEPRAGALYFALAPADLAFSFNPTVRIADTTFGVAAAIGGGKVVSPETDHIFPPTGEWIMSGPASVNAGFLSTPAVVGGGIHCISIALPTARRTIVTGRILDQNLDPMESAVLLARDGRSTTTNKDGLFAIPDVSATDANDVTQNVILQMLSTPFLTQHAMRVDALTGQPGPGFTTDFTDRPIATVPSGRVRILPIFEGEKQQNARIGVAELYGGRFEDAQFATLAGTEFWDVPVGFFEVTAVDDFNDVNALRTATRGNVKTAGSTTDLKVFLQRSRIRTPVHLGKIRQVAVRTNSLTPVFNSFHMLGLDGSGNQQGYSHAGLAGFGHALPGIVLTTVGQEVEASAFGTAGVDLYRKRAFHSQSTQAVFRRSPVSAFLNYLPKGYDRAGAFFGNVTQLTDANITVPVNGAFAVEVRSHHSESFERRIAIAMGAQRDVATDIPASAKRPNFSDPTFETLAPIGRSTIVAIERDAATSNSLNGKITKFGFVTDEQTFFAKRAEADIALTGAPNTTIQTTLAGGIAPQKVSLILETEDGQGVDLGDQTDFTFNIGNGALGVAAPAPVGEERVGIVTSASGATANGSSFDVAAACVAGEAFEFITIPELTAAAPPPGQKIIIAPTTVGISWAGDPDTSETFIKITRAATQNDPNGKIVNLDSEWTVRIPGNGSSFIFPTTPASSKNVAVPIFFESGKVYNLTIESRKYVNYDERTAATSPDAGVASFFNIRALSRTTVEVQIP